MRFRAWLLVSLLALWPVVGSTLAQDGPEPPPAAPAAPADDGQVDAAEAAEERVALARALDAAPVAPEVPDLSDPAWKMGHADDERPAVRINVTSREQLLAAGARGNGTFEAPFELSHLAIASNDSPAIRIENVAGYVRLHNMTLAGTKVIVASNISSLVIENVDGTAAVHGIETNNIRLLKVTNTNLSVHEFGVWSKKGQAIFDQLRVLGSRDALVLEKMKGSFTNVILVARRDGLHATETKAVLENVVVSGCEGRGLATTGGTLEAEGLAIECGRAGVEARFARTVSLAGVLVRGADRGVVLDTAGESTLRRVSVEGAREAGIHVIQSVADASRVSVDGGKVGVLAEDSDLTLGAATLDATEAGVRAVRSGALLRDLDVRGAATGIHLDHSDASFALPGVLVTGASVAIEADTSTLEGVGVTRVREPVGEAIGARLRRSGDGSAPFHWASVDVEDARLALVLEDGSDLHVMGLTARGTGQVARVSGGSALALEPAYTYVRDGDPYDWRDVGRLVEVVDRSFFSVNATRIKVAQPLPLVEATASVVDVNGSELLYLDPAPASAAPTLAPPAPPRRDDRTMFDLQRSHLQVRGTTLLDADVFVRAQGTLPPAKGALPEPILLHSSSVRGAKEATLLVEDAPVDIIGSVVRSDEDGYEYGLRLKGASTLRIAPWIDANGTYRSQGALVGARIADVDWDAPATLPASNITPPAANDARRSEAYPLLLDAQLGKATLRNLTPEKRVTIHNSTLWRLELLDAEVILQQSDIGSRYPSNYFGSLASAGGLVSNRTRPESTFHLENNVVKRLTLEGHSNATYVTNTTLGEVVVRNATGAGPAFVANVFNASVQKLDVSGGPVRFYRNVVNGSVDGALPRRSFALALENATPSYVVGNTLATGTSVEIVNTTAWYLRNRQGGSIQVESVGTHLVTITDNTIVDGGVTWKDARGSVSYNNFSQGDDDETLIRVLPAKGHAPATPDIVGNRLETAGTGITLAAGFAEAGDVSAAKQYEVGGRIVDNVFIGNVAAVSEPHGQYVEREDGRLVRRHEQPTGISLVGNTIEGGVWVHCHYYHFETVDSEGNREYHTEVDGQFACQDKGARGFITYLSTHHYGGAASGTPGPRPPTDPNERSPSDPNATRTRERSVPIAGAGGTYEVPCQGYELRRLDVRPRGIGLQKVHVTAVAHLAIVGPWEGRNCDALTDIQVRFLDNGTVVKDGTAADTVFTFDYKPQTGNLTMRATLASEGPAGAQELTLVRNLTGLQTSIGFVPIGELDSTYQATSELDQLRTQLTPEEFQQLVGAVVAAFAAIGIVYAYVPPEERNPPRGGAGGPVTGPGGGPGPTSQHYMDLAKSLSGNDPNGLPVGAVTKAALLFMKDTAVQAYESYVKFIENLQGLSDEDRTKYLAGLRALVQQAERDAADAGKLQIGKMALEMFGGEKADWKRDLLAKYPELALKMGESNLLDMLAAGHVTGGRLLSEFDNALGAAHAHAEREAQRISDMDTVEELWELGGPKYGQLQSLAAQDPQSRQALDAMRATSEGATAVRDADAAYRDFYLGVGLSIVSLGAGAALAYGGAAMSGGVRLAFTGVAELSNVYDAYAIGRNAVGLNAAVDNFRNASADEAVLGEGARDAAKAELGTAVDKVMSDLAGQAIGVGIGKATELTGALLGEVKDAVQDAIKAARTTPHLDAPSVPKGALDAPAAPSAGTIARPDVRAPSVEGPHVDPTSAPRPLAPETPARPHAPSRPHADEPHPALDTRYDDVPDDLDLPDPAIAARQAGVPDADIARAEALATLRTSNAADAANVRSTAIDSLRLAREGYDPYALHTPAGKQELTELASPVVRAHRDAMTPADIDVLKGRLAQDPRYLDALPQRGKVTNDGDWMPIAGEADVEALRAGLRKAGVDVPPPAPVKVKPSDVPLEDVVPIVGKDGKYYAPTADAPRVARMQPAGDDAPTFRQPAPDESSTVQLPPSAARRETPTVRLGEPDLPPDGPALDLVPTQQPVGFMHASDARTGLRDLYGHEGKKYVDALDMARAELGDQNVLGIAGSVPQGRARQGEWPVADFDSAKKLDKLPSNMPEDLLKRLPQEVQDLHALKKSTTLPSDLDVVVPKDADPKKLDAAARKVFDETGVYIEFTPGHAPPRAPHAPAVEANVPHGPARDVDVSGPIARPESEPTVGPPRGRDVGDAPAAMDDAARAKHMEDMAAAIHREAAAARPRAEPEAGPGATAQDPATRAAAIRESGMAPRHAEAASHVAKERDEFILMGATNKAATEPNDLGYLSKDMHVKGKSAAGGTFYDGMIPTDQSLSKAGSKPSAPDLARYGGKDGVVAHFNEEVQKTLDMKPYKLELTRPDGSKAEAMVSYQRMDVTGPNGEKVEVLGKRMEFLGPAGKPNGTVVEGPIVADYDMITIGTKAPTTTQIPDAHLGSVSQQQREVIAGLNDAMGRPLNPGVHHGAQSAAPINPGIPYPVTAFAPDGRVVTIPEGPKGAPDLHLKAFYDEMESKGYHAGVNKDWGWQRGEDGRWATGDSFDPKTGRPASADAKEGAR